MIRLLAAVLLAFAAHTAAAAQAQPCDKVPPQPATIQGARSFVYATPAGRPLSLHVFAPAAAGARPAVLFFFGGGWRQGAVTQFIGQAQAFQAAGYVAVLADYRVICRDPGSTPLLSVTDATAAHAWLRAHAGELHVDPRRIALAGGSAGGHIALTAAMLETKDRPAALVLFNPAVDLSRGATRGSAPISVDQARAISPAHLPVEGLPPTAIFHGEADQVVPIGPVRDLCARMPRCVLTAYPGQGHGFFNSRAADPATGLSNYDDTTTRALVFLAGLGWARP